MDKNRIITNLHDIDELYLSLSSAVRRHPMAHFLVTLAFIIVVISMKKYDLSGLLPFFVYPLSLIAIYGLALRPILRRILWLLPLIVLIGVFNPLFDRHLVAAGGLLISAGWLSFGALLLKGLLTITAALLLIALIGISGITSVLVNLRLPKIVITQLAFTYRYIHVLIEEAVWMITARQLRAPGHKGLSVKDFGSFIGGLFWRSWRRADNVYAAMRCRGFEGVMPTSTAQHFAWSDLIYVAGWLGFFVLANAYNLPRLIGGFMLMK